MLKMSNDVFGMYLQAAATQGTVTPFPGFDAEADCRKLSSAMKGLGK